MHRFKPKALLGIGLIALLTLGACSAADVATGAPLDEFTDALNEDVPRLMRRYGVPGVAMAIIRDGEPAWSRAYGVADRETDTIMTVDTVCRTESISKSVTAWGVMRLVEDGLLDLQRPAESYLGGWELPDSPYDESALTGDHLLSNRSGLPLGTIGPPAEYAPETPRPTAREFVEEDAVLVAEPGSGFFYSDVGFNTLELIVEELTGEPFAAYMDRTVLAPLGMADAGYAWRASYSAALGTGHEMDGSTVRAYVYPASASGGLFADVEDVARFVAAGMLQSDRAREGTLTTESLERIYRPRVDIPGLYGFVADGYGFGHFIETLPDGRTAVWHGGQGHGWMTHFHSVPESGDGIVILTNSQRSWPFIASVLPRWASWSGAGRVRFGVIIPATRVFWGLIAAVAAAVLWQAYRLVTGIRSGSRRVAPASGARVPLRLAQTLGGGGLIALVAWRIALPYVDEASIFPAAAPWAAVVFIAAGVALIASALMPAVGPRPKDA